MRTLRLISTIFMTCAVTASAVACSSSPAGPSAPSAPAAPSAPTAGASSPGSAGNSLAGAEQQVAANWTAFFSAKTSVAKRVELLQDGSQFQAIIQAQEGSSIAQQASATVTKVTMDSPVNPTLARVSYSILLAGTPALPGQTGTAVLQGGTWKVGVDSFCNLLSLENGGSKASLPAACQAG